MRSAPFSALYGSSISSSSYLSMNSEEERFDSPTKSQEINTRQDVQPAPAPAVKPSTIFAPTTNNNRRRRVAGSPSFFASLEEKIINLILPGAPPVPSPSRKPSEVLAWMTQSRRPASPKPSDVFCSIKPARKRRFIFSRVNTNQEPNRPIELKVTKHPTINDGATSVPSLATPAKKEASLRITLLKHRTLNSGMEMPSRPVPVSKPVVDSDSDDEEEQRRNEFEGWNEYD